MPKNYISNKDIIKLLRQMAAAYTILDENRFKIIAYEKAADTIEQLNLDLASFLEKNELNKLPGIGPNIEKHLREVFEFGKAKHFEETFKKMPSGMFYLLNLEKVGPKTAFKLTNFLNKKNKFSKEIKENTLLGKLETALKKGEIDHLEGFGPKKSAEILNSLQVYRKNKMKEKRFLLSTASEIAEQIVAYLKKSKDVLKIDILGSLRRRLSTIGDIDIAVATENPGKVIAHFLKYEKKAKTIEKGLQGASIELRNGLHVDLRLIDNKSYGSMLQYFTGSKQHNIALREYALRRGMSLSEYGIKIENSILRLRSGQELKNQNKHSNLRTYKFSDEKSFYNFLNLEYIPPEMRENLGEIELAGRRVQGKRSGLPKLVKLSDIKGDLHIHSDYDLKPSHDLGESKMLEILQEADVLGYEYLGVSDHNPKQVNLSESEINTIMKERCQYFVQKKYLKKNVQNNFTVKKVFVMLEIDIKPSGELSLPEKSFQYIDAGIASIHSSFEKTKSEMTKRILYALSHKKIKILGHPTGRLIGQRESIKAEWEKIFRYCKVRNIALEINAFPKRLDLPDMLVYQAVKMGLKFVINTDSHHISEMSLMKYGLDVARRGWAEKNDIINTLSCDQFESWLKS